MFSNRYCSGTDPPFLWYYGYVGGPGRPSLMCTFCGKCRTRCSVWGWWVVVEVVAVVVVEVELLVFEVSSVR